MNDGQTFKEAYATLQKHAQALRSQQEPDIDNLTTIVSESVAAYKVCKQRIDAVEKALEQSLGNAQLGSDADVTTQGTASSEDGGSTGGDDDVPF